MNAPEISFDYRHTQDLQAVFQNLSKEPLEIPEIGGE